MQIWDDYLGNILKDQAIMSKKALNVSFVDDFIMHGDELYLY